LIVYAVMHFTRHFDIVGFRDGWATLHLLGFLVVSTVAYWLLGLVPALFVVLIALLYSPLGFFYTQADGTFGGFYGWANALRYVAPLVVVPTLAALVRDVPRRLPLLALGVLWGICAWISQENLTGTAAAVCLFVTLLWLTDTVSMRCVARIFSHLTIGFLCSVVPIVAFYAWHGAAGEFVHNYFVIARAVMAGWSNAWWPSEGGGPGLSSYYLTLPFLLVLALFGLWQFSPLKLSMALDWRRRRFLAFICVQLVCYQTALLRSDSSHLMNTLIALPFIVVLGFLDIPSWLEAWHPVVVRAVFATAVLIVYPAFASHLPFDWIRVLIQPAAKLMREPVPEARAGYEGRVAYKRLPPLLRVPEIGNAAGLSTQEFLEFVTEMHEAIGNRKTYIVDLGRVYLADGLLYFFADLIPAPGLPAPGLPDQGTMGMGDDIGRAVAERIRTQPDQFECVIGSSLDGPEARAFLDTHPRAQKLERQFGEATLHILITQPEPGR
jgi:hypothetical protein